MTSSKRHGGDEKQLGLRGPQTICASCKRAGSTLPRPVTVGIGTPCAEQPMDSGQPYPSPLPQITDGHGSGAIVRSARQAQRMTLADLGRRTGYSAAQISRYERGIAPLTDVTVLRRFAAALTIPPQIFGLMPEDAPTPPGAALSQTRAPRVSRETREDGDKVRRRQLLAHLAVTAAAAAGSAATRGQATPTGAAGAGELLVGRVRDAMLGLGTLPAQQSVDRLPKDLAVAMRDFHGCRYGRLAGALPRLITAGHAVTADRPDDADANALLAEIYTLATRMLIKLDDQQLGWMAADRAQVIAGAVGNALIAGEAARNLAVLARKAGWHAQAMSIALTAADHPGLRSGNPRHVAERGLLIQSAAYTAAKSGDRATMRNLTEEAAAIAAGLGGGTLLRDHGGGLSATTVNLHRISAEYSIGEP
ncbi:MAG TPA: helix-turn-helix domain-containing protein, partial [Streptosporangiaceae bacterium]